MVVTVPPKEGVELWGQLTAPVGEGVKITPRASDWLPGGVQVIEAELYVGLLPRVRLQVQNSSPRSVDIQSTVVLAELHQDGRGTTTPGLEAVVGPGCTSGVSVDGVETTGLIDSGSQITVVGETFFRQHLSHRPLQQMTDALGIVGAGGHTVPYIGVVAVDIGVSQEKTVNTYAVVCPDTRLSQSTPVIIGTNTLRKLSPSFAVPIRCEVAYACKEAATPPSGRLGSVRVPGRGMTVRPHAAVTITGRAKGVQSTREEALVQEPTEATLPWGLQVLSSKVSTSCLPRVKVTLINRTDIPIQVKGGKVVADLFAIQGQYALSSVLQQLQARRNVSTGGPGA